MGRTDDQIAPTAAEQRLEEMFRRHYGAVHAYVQRRAPAEVADDVAADTFLVAWRRLDDVPANALPWLLGVARRTLSTHHRASSRRAAFMRRMESLAAPAAADVPAADADRGVVEALATLSDRDREAITLVAWEELTPRDAAAVLDEPAVTFRVRLHRAKRRLRSEIARRERGVNQAAPPMANPLQLTEDRSRA